MNFIEALYKLAGSSDVPFKDRKKIFRPVWKKIKYPVIYVWLNYQNVPLAYIGDNQSMPLFLAVCDYVADDWEIYKGR